MVLIIHSVRIMEVVICFRCIVDRVISFSIAYDLSLCRRAVRLTLGFFGLGLDLVVCGRSFSFSVVALVV